MINMIRGKNIGLICNRAAVGSEFSFIGVSDCITTHGTFYLGNRGQDYLMPLYVYPETGVQDLFEGSEKQSNLNPEVFSGFQAFARHTSPEDVFYYTLAHLFSPSYRKLYFDQLMSDFPMVPYPKDQDQLIRLADLGEKVSE